jgi:hypothetical protein
MLMKFADAAELEGVTNNSVDKTLIQSQGKLMVAKSK